ncbi:MAG TPA: hypothetical protein VGC14_08495 [Rhizobium sp.]
MAARQEKIRIEVFGPATESALAADGRTRADEAVLRLARLIGRQMARDDFERRHGKRAKRTTDKSKAATSS